MCGIALILSGVDVLGSNLYREYDGTPSSEVNEVSKISQPTLVVEDLKSAIGRRGPDNIGFKKIFLRSQKRNGPGEDDVEEYLEEGPCVRLEENKNGNLSSRFEDAKLEDADSNGAPAELYFIGATLQLRGVGPICQPLVDLCGNVLVFNGEIFGGIHVCDDRNDAETLLQVLESCCHCNNDVNEKVCSCTIQSIPEIISLIRGPWALVYWQKKSRTLWFGRDAFGRRSILVHWPTLGDSRFVLSSVSPASTIRKSSGFIVPDVDTDVGHPTSSDCYWEELPCGVYSIQFKASESNELLVKGKLIAEVRKHKWTDPLLNRLIEWERKYVDPTTGHCFSKDPQLRMDLLVFPSVTPNGIQQDVADVGNVGMQQEEDTLDTHNDLPGDTGPVEKLLSALRESVRRRTVNNTFKTFQQEDEMDDHAPIAILFSGGLDSMILSAILDQCLDPRCTIDLLNVSFDAQLAPDRVSARIGLAELQRVAPSRRWRLVEIDATLSNLTWETEHLISLIHPAQTYMDLNIGIALWLAAGGDGWVDGRLCNSQQSNPRYRYKSTARILLVGSGADEQCAGYGRHRTKYRLGGWVALHEEMRLDMQRIWKRNMGRDDRCISDHGKEARFPFLDEDVVQTLLNFPLWDIAVLDKPSGIGDKKILREVARLLGLEQAASLPKRAIQFGSRIARESNRKNFGSNRAANQASAGSVVIHQSLH